MPSLDEGRLCCLPCKENARVEHVQGLTLRVGHCTRGRSAPDTGAGATAAAFSALALRRAFFCIGWAKPVLTRRAHFLWKCWLGMMLLCLTMVLAVYYNV